MPQTKIAFIGLGNMGKPMAINLQKAGHSLCVYDLNQAAVAELKTHGASAATSVAQAVSQADVCITMLPSSPHVQSVYVGEGQLLAHAKKGALLIDCSTISPQVAKEVAAQAQKSGFEMIDAPVSGGVGGATAGTLTFIVGGKTNSFEKAKPILSHMGKNIFHAGENGSGQVAKICNNMLLAIHMIGSSEAINLGIANGIDPKTLSDIMKVSSGGNWSLEKYNPHPGIMEGVPASRQYAGGFGVDLMSKDLGLAMEAALHTKTNTPLGALAQQIYSLHSCAGNGQLDFSSVIQFLKKADK